MTPETLERHFDLLTDAPNAAKKLRELVLQLAVQGKLVEQDPSDEPAGVLLERIEAEKKRLIEEKKIKKSKPLPAVKGDEIPFEVPQNWQWIRLNDVGHDWGQKKPNTKFTYVDVSSIDKEKGIISEDVNVLRPEDAPSRARKLVSVGTVIYSTVRPYLLNIAVVDKTFQPEPIVSTAFAIVHPFSGVYNRYLYHYLRSKPFIEYVEDQMSGMAYPAINDGKFFNGLFPLPPLEEQKRIVAKVDELMGLIDRLEAQGRAQRNARMRFGGAALGSLLSAEDADTFAGSWRRVRDNFDLLCATPRGVAELRKAVLQLAVQGKLVPQNPEDEPAGVLLERIEVERQQLVEEGTAKKFKRTFPIEDEVTLPPSPENWQWTRLGKLLIFGPTNGYSPKAVEHATSVKSLTLSATTSGTFNGEHFKFIDESVDTESHLWLNRSDVLIQRGNALEYVGVAAVFEGNSREFIYPDLMMKIRFSTYLDVKFMHQVLNSEFSRTYLRERATGTSGSMPKINQSTLVSLPILVPPLNEQKRIVAKVDELMGLIDTLEEGLKRAQGDAERLLEAAVRSLLTRNRAASARRSRADAQGKIG